jgi:hypothetical protein
VRRAIKDEDLMNEAEIAHDSAKTLIRQLERMKASDPKYTAAFTVLCEYTEHHVEEEEDPARGQPQVSREPVQHDNSAHAAAAAVGAVGAVVAPPKSGKPDQAQ